MKKSVIIGIIVGIVILIIIGFFFLSYDSEEIEDESKQKYDSEEIEDESKQKSGINCADYDGNEEACLLYSECKWDADENLCDSIYEEDFDDDEEKEDMEEDTEDEIEGDLEYESPWVEEQGKRIEDGYFFDVSVVELDDGTYRMYGEKGANIESYVSSDGLLWEKENGIRFENAAFPYVTKTSDGKWRLFYTPSGAGIEQNRFLSATSSDGINFVKESGERYVGKTDLEEKLQGPRIIQLNDGTYRMYFTAISGSGISEKSIILSAISDDAFSWEKEDGIRLDPDSEPFIGSRVAHAWPVILDNGNIQIFFAGATTQGGGILSAVSGNGLDFTVNPYPEIEETSEEISIEEAGLSPQDACVISMDGQLRMYYGIYKGPEVVDESGIYSAVYESN